LKINLAFGDNATTSSADGEILVALNPLNHRPTADYVRTLRYRLRQRFPDMEFYFQAADIVGQILNFGLPAPIDIQMTGRDPKNYALAKEIEARVEKIPGAADVHLHQLVHGPDLRVNVDRTRAEQLGLSQRDVAGTVLTSLSSSGQASPNFWLNFQNGVNYQVAVQTPQYKMDSLSSLLNTSIATSGQTQPQLLALTGILPGGLWILETT
jgi:multidrug efflux pump subunit AcrB